MKWKQILTIGLSAATIMSAVPAESVLVYADTEMEAVSDGNEEISIADESQTEDNNESAETELTGDTEELTANAEEATGDAEELTVDTEGTAEENTETENLFSDDTEGQSEAAGADSEYGNVVDSGTIPDETSGTEVTWTVYDSGKLVLGGTGVTPDWSPWFENKESITDVIVGDGITALGERNFINYPALKTATFQGVISKIGNSAFEGCKLLRNIKVEGKASST